MDDAPIDGRAARPRLFRSPAIRCRAGRMRLPLEIVEAVRGTMRCFARSEIFDDNGCTNPASMVAFFERYERSFHAAASVK